MMLAKRLEWLALAVFAVAIVAVSGLAFQAVSAQESEGAAPAPSEARLKAISSECNLIKTRLRNAQKIDLEARVKRGRAYDQELLPYVTAFNSRVAANQVDAPELISVAAALQTAVSGAEFARLYTTYADQLERAIRTDCDNPEAMHYAIERARTDRKALMRQVKTIDGLIGDYIEGLGKVEEKFEPAINRPQDNSETTDTNQ